MVKVKAYREPLDEASRMPLSRKPLGWRDRRRADEDSALPHASSTSHCNLWGATANGGYCQAIQSFSSAGW